MSIASLANLLSWKPDRAKVLASQLTSKAYFAGEAAGLQSASREGQSITTNSIIFPNRWIYTGLERLGQPLPQHAPSTEIRALITKLEKTMEDIRGKNSTLTVQDLKRLLFRCAATLISMEMASIYTFLW